MQHRWGIRMQCDIVTSYVSTLRGPTVQSSNSFHAVRLYEQPCACWPTPQSRSVPMLGYRIAFSVSAANDRLLNQHSRCLTCPVLCISWIAICVPWNSRCHWERAHPRQSDERRRSQHAGYGGTLYSRSI